MSIDEIQKRIQDGDEWLDGYLCALYEWAYMKDGAMYVGSCGTTYAEAKKRALKIAKERAKL